MALSIERLESKTDILRFLNQDRLYAAYAIGDLEPSLFRQCDWYAALRDRMPTTLCLRFRGLRPNRVFVMGSAEGLVPILRHVLKPDRAYFACQREHLSVVSRFYTVEKVQDMLRMVLDPDGFSPVDGPVVRLGQRHLRQLQELYGWGGNVAFASYQFDQGVFYGLEQSQKLVSTAGTHLVSRVHGLGIVGNVFTHPDYRGQGYATMCTSAVVEELLSQSLDVVLNAELGNRPAESMYRRLGFQAYCAFVEALASRKSGLRKGAAVWLKTMM